MPFALASSANCRFHTSKPAAVLPHCAAYALALIPASTVTVAKIAVANCLPLIISELPFHWLPKPNPTRERITGYRGYKPAERATTSVSAQNGAFWPAIAAAAAISITS